MRDNNSTSSWSVGIPIIQWRMRNTQINRSTGNSIPYENLFGQKPRVGLSNLPMDSSLIETLVIVHCNCGGSCNTEKCSCKKANRLCSSHCHRNNSNCKNYADTITT